MKSEDRTIRLRCTEEWFEWVNIEAQKLLKVQRIPDSEDAHGVPAYTLSFMVLDENADPEEVRRYEYDTDHTVTADELFEKNMKKSEDK